MADTYEKDGLLYCSVCNEPLQHKYELNGVQHVVRVSCKCAENRRVQEENERNQALRRERIQEAREAAFQDKRMFVYTFDRDDGINGDMTMVSLNYVKHFDEFAKDGKGIIFYGGVGVGKTFYAGCIANALIDKGYSVIFTNFSSLAAQIYGADKQAYLNKLSKCDLLIIDDLAAERETEYMGELIQMVIDRRYMNDKPIIITTNLTNAQLKEQQNIRRARIYSRLFEMCLPVEVKGTDRRRQYLQENYNKMKKLLGNC